MTRRSPPKSRKCRSKPRIAELEGIVDRLEKGNVTLEESIRSTSAAKLLKARCEALLKDAEMRIEKITLGADGKPKGSAAGSRSGAGGHASLASPCRSPKLDRLRPPAPRFAGHPREILPSAQ